jgi:hypothetical protein
MEDQNISNEIQGIVSFTISLSEGATQQSTIAFDNGRIISLGWEGSGTILLGNASELRGQSVTVDTLIGSLGAESANIGYSLQSETGGSWDSSEKIVFQNKQPTLVHFAFHFCPRWPFC